LILKIIFLRVACPLTTGANTFTGSLGVDTFNADLSSASLQTLNTLDQLAGGSGADVLNAELIASVTPASITGIETINVSASAAATLGLANATGVTNVNISGVTGGAFVVSGIGKAVAVAIADTAYDHTVT